MVPIVSEEVLAILKDAGYVEEHTGGGCMAWMKWPKGDTRTVLYISNANDLDGMPSEAIWSVGRYSAIGIGSIDYCDEVTLDRAIAIAERLPSPILDDGAEVQDTIGPNRLLPITES